VQPATSQPLKKRRVFSVTTAHGTNFRRFCRLAPVICDAALPFERSTVLGAGTRSG
jgi:hypothetical protein